MSRLLERAALQGKVAAVIGGASGIGEAVTMALAAEGVDVALCDIASASIEPTCAAVEALGVRALAMAADATDRVALGSFYAAVAEQFGRLDIVVNVAGGTSRRRFEDGDPMQDEADIRRNYGYVVDSIRHALPLIRRGGQGGSVINFTTIEAHRGAATFAVYAGAKAATTNFTRALAVELAAERIRINCIAPDTTPSEGNVRALEPAQRERMGDVPTEVLANGLAMYVPMKASPMPVDLADAVLFLASGLSAFVTGTTIHVDGGTSAASGFLDWPFGDGFVPAPLAGSAARLFGGETS